MQIHTKPSHRISVLLVTFNHENYIRQALNSLFGQVFNEPIELIIADDASSDATLNLIKEYEGKDDRFTFKYLDSTTNLGITKNYKRGFSACLGQYVAVLEGDDYWISAFKLQRQIDFLDTHWESDLCSVNYFVLEEDRFHFHPRAAIGNGHRLISARDLIADNLVGNFSTCMYRKTALDTLPLKLFEICSYDWIVNICVARSSLIGFLEEPMSVYRLHSNGVWTQTPHVEKLKQQLEIVPEYDNLTNNVFHAEFEVLSNRLHHKIQTANLVDAVAVMTPSTAGKISRMMDYLPPVLLSVARVFIPPKLKRLIVRVIQRDAA
ncbi:glycosyl transferase [Limnohabitans sp. Rim8]|uniref:glycosyltransferase n=1 Tax=Limnohabitans sp. Rim8 TaxID=1100718 RepID=UPI000D35DD56|nr:glycosyltransferase [Limnohabitans sp. Rim8]PUE54813.1 glycosyl transferase [Limnohabitans sp. Rim8]